MPQSRADPPVVSRSMTQNVTSCSGVPRSSNERCPVVAMAREVIRTYVRCQDPGGGALVTTRYRCTSCGNLTRFDVTSTRRTRAFHHYTVGGELAVEDEQVLDETIESIECRWCGTAGIVEAIDEAAEPVEPVNEG